MITQRSQMKNLWPLVLFVSNRVAPGPRRGHTMVTAGLDPRVIEISCIYDPKGVAHHHASSRTDRHTGCCASPLGTRCWD